MTVWALILAGGLAALLSVIELWRTGDHFWLRGGWWSVGLVTADVSMAIGITYGTPGLLPAQVSSRPATLLLLAVVSAVLAGRALYLLPIHAARTAAKRLMTLRRFVLLEIEQHARSARTLYLMDTVYPAAAFLGHAAVKDLTILLLQDWERKGNHVSDEVARELLNAESGAMWPVEKTMPILIRYGGLAACSLIVKRSSTVAMTAKLAVAHDSTRADGRRSSVLPTIDRSEDATATYT